MTKVRGQRDSVDVDMETSSVDGNQQNPKRPATSRRYLRWVAVLAIVLGVVFVRYQSAKQQRIANALNSINQVTYVNELWRYPRLIEPVCRLIFNAPPNHFLKYSVQLTREQITDDMIDQLITIEALDSLTVLGIHPSGEAQQSPVPLHQMSIAASTDSIDRLLEHYPELYIYVDPLEEFETSTVSDATD